MSATAIDGDDFVRGEVQSKIAYTCINSPTNPSTIAALRGMSPKPVVDMGVHNTV
ncbi:hypothetical protein HWV62_2135 [Athelia sp. TMB]|nr:hypothetical protein HWV62_22259 [Athelia sp. TMB]KAF7985631.1 hypothetical protein HWV62_2135 [Athelia sp. TMB]